MKIYYFNIDYVNFQITIDPEYLELIWPFQNLFVEANDIIEISFKPNNVGSLYADCVYFYVKYRKKTGKIGKKTYVVPLSDPKADEFFEELKKTYPKASKLGPNEEEKNLILSKKNKYYLESAVSAVWKFVILFISVTLLCVDYFMHSSSLFAPDFLFAILIPGIYSIFWFLMLIFQKTHIIKTSKNGLYIRKFIRKKQFMWNDVKITVQNTKIRNKNGHISPSIYSKLGFGHVIIRFYNKHKSIAVKVTVVSASRLYRELYYRNLVTLPEAKEMLAFL